ncbi:MAG TPA: hypothetical protein VFY41_01660, partial [Nitrososphaeraceae archaeon]|nr:hypothetical protein [Nitrososphaeraceae archaeon]
MTTMGSREHISMITILLFSGRVCSQGFFYLLYNWKRLLHYIVNQRKAYQLTQNKNNIYYMYTFKDKITGL